MLRTLLGIWIAPLIPSVAVMTYAGFGLGILLSYFWCLLFGLPTILVLKRMNKESHQAYSLVGLSIGVLFSFISAGVNVEGLMLCLFFGALGLFTALCFSLVQGKNEKKFGSNQSAHTTPASAPRQPSPMAFTLAKKMEITRKSVEARIRMLSTQEGGRNNPIYSGYRPNHNFGDEKNRSMQMGQIELLSTDELFPGKEALAKIEFVVREGFPFPIEEGSKWRIQEGPRVVAYGEMTKVIDDEKKC